MKVSCVSSNLIRKRCCTPHLAKPSKHGKFASLQHTGQLPWEHGEKVEKQQLRPSCYPVHCNTFLLPWCWQPDHTTEEGTTNSNTILRKRVALSTVEADRESQHKPQSLLYEPWLPLFQIRSLKHSLHKIYDSGEDSSKISISASSIPFSKGNKSWWQRKKKKVWDRAGTFLQQKKEGTPPPPNFSPFLRIPLTSVSPALAVDVPWSLLAKGYAACWIFTDKKKTSEFLSVGDKQDRRKPQRELQSITVTKLEDRGNMARPHQQNNTAQEWPRPRSLFLHHSTNFSKSINIGEQYGRTLQRPI